MDGKAKGVGILGCTVLVIKYLGVIAILSIPIYLVYRFIRYFLDR